MGELIYGKLVRDKIPEIIEADGQTPVIRTLGTAEFRRALLEKLVEEATELLESDGDVGERADVAEVLEALDEVLGYTGDEIASVKIKKFEKRGGFSEKIYLEKAITHD